jgi:hypothetical protein
MRVAAFIYNVLVCLIAQREVYFVPIFINLGRIVFFRVNPPPPQFWPNTNFEEQTFKQDLD